MSLLPPSSVPRPFLWGVATSSDQHEGGFNQAGQPMNNWAAAEREKKVEVSGKSADFWHFSTQDFARCRSLGLNAFRMSLSWPRIQPVTDFSEVSGPPPSFDYAALDHYASMIAECRRSGLEPVLTLHHFTHPLWLGLDAWLNPETIRHFLVYVREAVGYLLRVLPEKFDCLPPRYYITINEPNMLASCTYLIGAFPGGEKGVRPFLVCLENLLEAHVRAYRLVHELCREAGAAAPQVSFNNYCSDLYWNDQAWLDMMFASQRGVPRTKLFSHLWECAWSFDRSFDEANLPIGPWGRRACGELIKKAQHFLAYACSFDSEWGRLADLIYENDRAPIDFIAIDYYDPFAAHALRLPYWKDNLSPESGFYERFLNSVTSKWWDWKLLPDGLAFFVRSLGRFNLPILIAENGMAHYCENEGSCSIRRDKVKRSEYVRQHVKMVSQLVKEGHPLFGYLYWSLVDNYEWGTYAARFGLYSVDFSQPGERREVNFFGDNAAAAYALSIAEAKEEMVVINHTG